MNFKKIFLILVVIILVLAGWFWYKSGSSSESDQSSLGLEVLDEQVGEKTISLLNKMSQVKLDNSIFSNPFLETGKDNRISIPPQPVGRVNPFAPIGTRL